MSKLSFDVTINSSDFIEKAGQIRSAIQDMADEMAEQGQKMGLSFEQMTDKVSFNAIAVGKVIKDMLGQINSAMETLRKLDVENQARLKSLQNGFSQASDNPIKDCPSEKESISLEIESRENLSEDIRNQSTEIVQLNAELLEYKQKLEEVQNELSALRTEMLSVNEQMEKMRNTGQQNTEAYAEWQKKSENLSVAMEKVSADATFEGITSGLDGLSSAFETASSMLALFSLENETLQNIMQKVQLAIAVTNGLQKVNAALSKESAFQLNVVGQLKMWYRNIIFQVATAQGMETAAAATATPVNLGLAGSFHAIGLAIKSIPVIGWILTGISVLIGLYSLWSSRTKEQQVNQEQLNKSIKEFNEGIQGYAAKPVAMIELLSIKFKALGDNMNAQKKFVADNKKAFDELGVSINSVKDAQQLLIDNKDKFVEAQIAKAVSLVYADKMQEEAKKYVEAKYAADIWNKVGEKKDKESTVYVNGISIRKGEQPADMNEYHTLKAKGMLSDDGNILRYDEILARDYSKQAETYKENMKRWGSLSFSKSKEANGIMAEIAPDNKMSKLGGADKIQKAEEIYGNYMRILDKQRTERIRFAEDSENRIQQAEIDAMNDGSEKTYKQLKLNQKKEKQALERGIEDLKRQRIEGAKKVFDAKEEAEIASGTKSEKQKFDPSTVKMTDIDKEFTQRSDNLGKKHLNELRAYYASEREAMNEYLKDYASIMEKRKAVKDLNKQMSEGKSEEEVSIINIETNKSLADLDIQAAESSSAFGQLFSDVKDRSVKNMRSIIDEAQKALDFIKAGSWDEAKGQEFGISQDSFNALKNSAPEIDKIQNGITELNNQANASDTALGKMGDGFNKLFNSGSDPEKLKQALNDIDGAMNEVTQSVQFFSNCLSSIGDAFGNDTFGDIADGMSVATDAMGAAMSGAQAGAAFGPWGAAAGAAIGLVSSLSSSLAKLHDAKHEKSIQAIQKQIEVLEKTYENLGESLDKAFSSDASELIDQQNTLLEQQKVLIRNQIAEEKSKKKTDWGRIEEWEKQIEDIDKVIAGNKEKKIDVIFGEDLKAAIENFAQAYADAWSAGDDRAKSSKELVKNMIKQMITEAIKAASSKPMEELRKRLASFFSDGIISDWERKQIEKDAEAIANDLDRQFGWADEYMKGDDKESSSQESTKGGFTSMSQETGEELNGRFTALQISNEEIKNSMFFILGNLSSLCTHTSNNSLLLTEMRNLAVMSNGHLEDIAKYTKVLLGFGEKLDNIAYNTKSLTVK